MLTREENDLITRVCGDAPLGQMMRTHCLDPRPLSPQLVADGRLFASRLLGEDYVAFRATDGRSASSTRPARIGASRSRSRATRTTRCAASSTAGSTTSRRRLRRGPDAARQSRRASARTVQLDALPGARSGRDRSGSIWARASRRRSPIRVLGLPAPSHVLPTHGHRPLQLAAGGRDDDGFRAPGHPALDSIKSLGDIGITKDYTAPVYETEHKPYGFRYASIRNRNEGDAYVRVNTFVAPWFAFIAPTEQQRTGLHRAVQRPGRRRAQHLFPPRVPSQRHRHEGLPALQVPYGSDRLAARTARGPENSWGQDREAMKHGHFTGFRQNLLTEDLVCRRRA